MTENGGKTFYEMENGGGSRVQFARSDSEFKMPWWKRRTKCEIVSTVMLVLSLGACLALLIVLLQQPENGGTSGEQGGGKPTDSGIDVCTSPDCVSSAALMIESIDATVDPCDDFFEYACGAWNKKHLIPDDKSTYNTFSKLRDELTARLKSLLEAPLNDKDSATTTKAKTLYQSCVNESVIEERKDQPIQDFLKTFGGWPIIDPKWDESSFDLMKLISDLRKYNNKIIINNWISPDDRNSTVNIIQFDQPDLGMPSRDYYLKGRDSESLMAYQRYAEKVAIALGADSTNASKDANDIVDLEIRLANVTVPAEDRRDNEALYNRMTVAQLYTNVTDKFDWRRYLSLAFGPLNMTIDDTEDVIVYSPVYLRKAADIVEDTPNRTLANYLIWRIVINRMNNLNRGLRDLKNEYNKAVYGTDVQGSWWRKCVSYTSDNVGMGVGKMFVEKYFDESAKSDTLEMIENIRHAFNELLGSVSWLDDETRAVAREKADAIGEKIGYPDYILNDTLVDADYNYLQFESDKYFENVLENLSENSKRGLLSLRKPVDKTTWSTYPQVVNAFYSQSKNMIMFPAGILQPPFYKKTNLKALNYGGIGMVIGHEITHGFDDRGRQYNKDGNLVEWWTPEVVSGFKKKAQCIVEQYGNYTVEEIGMKMNGVNTQGENIADNGGIKQSFKAYREWVAKQGREEQRLPGMQQYTPNQLFFLNFAQIWCGSMRPAYALTRIRTGVHSPNEFRVKGALSNSKEFAEAFNCPVGSTMNPANKCAVW